MSFLSKETILSAYTAMSGLTNDPSAQGATQVTSSLRYLMALAQFYQIFKRPCNTQSKEDKDKYVEYVGIVVSINDEYYTANFFNSIKESKPNYNVGSNFFSVNTVVKSLENRDKEYDFPKRGKSPLMIIKGGELIERKEYFKNIRTILSNDLLKCSFSLWLVRNEDIQEYNYYDSIRAILEKRYSKELIDEILPNQEIFNSNYQLKWETNKAELLITDFPRNNKFGKDGKNKKEGSSRISDDSKDIQYITAIRTKPFLLLAGISGTGKSRIVRKLAQATVTEELQKKYDKDFKTDDFENDRWNLHRPANFELIQVKPNWHNSMDVIGYQSNLPSPHYEFTPFIHFIARAWKEKDKKIPFFLCLDEMNLAPVEEYFAEFLSAIESRDKESSDYVTDPLIKPFNQFGHQNAIDMITAINDGLKISENDKNELGTVLEDQFRKKGLTLPPNLIVIGTVNMDETTFSFSRKVLDRAMSIEMNEVNYDTFLIGDTDEGLKDLVNSKNDINELLVDRPIQAKEILDNIGDDAESVIDYLKRINALLDGTPFKLGYRVANEALLYLNASADFDNPDWRDAMDKFTLMKILSRIEGDTNKLKLSTTEDRRKLESEDLHVDIKKAESYGQLTILTALKVILEEELGMPETVESGNTDSSMGETLLYESLVEDNNKPKPRELESVKKLDSMISQLERERFVSYWN